MVFEVTVSPSWVVRWNANFFDTELPSVDLESVQMILDFVENMDDAEFKELEDNFPEFIKQCGKIAEGSAEGNKLIIGDDVVSNRVLGAKLSVEKTSGKARQTPDYLPRMRELFAEGINEPKEITKRLIAEGYEPTASTIRKNVIILRKEFGISKPKTRTGGARSKGLGAKIKELFAEGNGLITYETMNPELHQWATESGGQYSPGSVRSQLSRLRGEFKDVISKRSDYVASKRGRPARVASAL